jgi:hypothetical protein
MYSCTCIYISVYTYSSIDVYMYILRGTLRAVTLKVEVCFYICIHMYVCCCANVCIEYSLMPMSRYRCIYVHPERYLKSSHFKRRGIFNEQIYMCICVCVFVYMCMCIYQYVYKRVWIYVYIYECLCMSFIWREGFIFAETLRASL